MAAYPPTIVKANHAAPAPRRVRGMLGGRPVFDTLRALYVWEWPPYPQYYIPRDDVDLTLFEPHGAPFETPQGNAQSYRLRAGGTERSADARIILASPIPGLTGTVRPAWDMLDAWFEEDEEIFVHPRNPYARVDALRSRRSVRVEFHGATLAESEATVMVFETGLPTRYYFDPRDVRFAHLTASETRTACPYKGRTTGYWSLSANGATQADAAWSYAFPTAALLPIAGLVAFLNERVDITIDGVAQRRPSTHMGN